MGCDGPRPGFEALLERREPPQPLPLPLPLPLMLLWKLELKLP